MICLPGGNTRSLDPKNVRCVAVSLLLRVAWKVTWELLIPRFKALPHNQCSSIRKKEAQQCEQEQCYFIMEVLQVISFRIQVMFHETLHGFYLFWNGPWIVKIFREDTQLMLSLLTLLVSDWGSSRGVNENVRITSMLSANVSLIVSNWQLN